MVFILKRTLNSKYLNSTQKMETVNIYQHLDLKLELYLYDFLHPRQGKYGH
jgi:hypothetical protein